MRLFDLSGRVALITGGNGGIGLAMAGGLAEAGASVMIAGRDLAKNKRAIGAIRARGGEAEAVSGDVTDEAACWAMLEATIEHYGRLDILINNAGTAIRKQPQDYSLAEWHRVLDTNLTSAFVLCQAAYPHLKAAGGGKIINVASILAIFGASFSAPYAASKAGLVQLTKVLATAWAADGIQVNAVLPGWIDTELTVGARAAVPGLQERVLARTPAGRWGAPDDLAGIAVFLAGPGSDFVTGAAIPVDGGFASQG